MYNVQCTATTAHKKTGGAGCRAVVSPSLSAATVPERPEETRDA